MFKQLFIFALCILVVACSKQAIQKPETISDLRGAPLDYRMRVSQYCFCPQELLGPFDVEVRDGKAVSAIRVSDNEEMPLSYVGNQIPSIDLTLKHIADAQKNKAHKIDVEWLKEPFVPSKVLLDYSELMSDDEINITIKRFELL